MKKIIAAAILSLLLTSCKETLDVYLGVPLQPRFDSDTFKPGLNIFGVIRIDSTASFNNSFILLQKVVPAVGDSTGWEIDTATVWVSKLSIHDTDTVCEFVLSSRDSIFRETAYRPECNFNPQPGDIYISECIYEDMPVLYAKTIVPNKPVCTSPTFTFENNSVELSVLPDTTFFMLDAFVYSNGQVINSVRLPSVDELNTNILVSPVYEEPDSVVLFSYDYNLAVYYLASNTSLNFNKYRKSFSTVENGYGVLGAINKNTFLAR